MTDMEDRYGTNFEQIEKKDEKMCYDEEAKTMFESATYVPQIKMN